VEGDVLRVDTALVTVPVSVTDRNGKNIPNLRKQEFHIFDEGVEQRIAYFATVDQPFTVALVIDTSGSTHFRLNEIQDAAIAFVNQLKPQDRVMVISFDDQIKVLSEPTNNRDDLTSAIRRTRTGRGTRLYDAVDLVIKEKLKTIPGRKAVVLFTDGVDTTSRHATYSSTVLAAEQSDAAVYTVAYDTAGDLGGGQGRGRGRYPGGRGGVGMGVPWPGSGGGRGGGGGGSSPGDYRRAGEYLRELAQESGGRYFRGDSLADVTTAFAQVADELRRQYSLGYYPPPGQFGARRQITVRVNQPDLVVKSRDSYIYSQKTNEKDTGGQSSVGTNSATKHLSLSR
jgi:VWFA-related protein